MKNTLGTRIKTMRAENGLSQADLAELIGISVTSLSEYERGVREPRKETLEKMSDWFNVRYQWLKTGVGAKTEEEEKTRKITVQTQKIVETTKIVSTADKERFKVISELIALLPDMGISRDKQKEIYKVLVYYRNDLESKVLFGDEGAARRQATALYGG